MRLLVALAVVLIAVGVASAVRRRRGADAPTQPGSALPAQLDRSDFDGTGWLVVVFTSDTCSTCADVARKAAVVASPAVTVQVASYQARRDLHERYRIDAVPAALIADAAGVVHRTFVGPVTATDLWAAVVTARQP